MRSCVGCIRSPNRRDAGCSSRSAACDSTVIVGGGAISPLIVLIFRRHRKDFYLSMSFLTIVSFEAQQQSLNAACATNLHFLTTLHIAALAVAGAAQRVLPSRTAPRRSRSPSSGTGRGRAPSGARSRACPRTAGSPGARSSAETLLQNTKVNIRKPYNSNT